MRLKYLLMILLSIQCASITALADNALWEGTDITPLVRLFRSHVKVMKQPIMVYHWNNSGFAGEGEIALRAAKRMSQVFWDRYGDSNINYNMYGYGLYVAMDPVASHTFGASDSWSLLELQLPQGLKILDLGLSSPPIPEEENAAIESLLAKFQCPSFNGLEPLFKSGGNDLDASCQKLVRYIFKDLLQIGGFFYHYPQSTFRVCQNGVEYRAFVVTDPHWLNSEDVRFFNKQSTYARENRIRIQTLFIEERQSAISLTSEARNTIVQYLSKNPNRYYSGSRSICAEATCEVIVRFCDAKEQCDTVSLGHYQRPGGPTITTAEVQKTLRPQGLLWSDLEGAPKFSTTTEWLRSYTFSCSGSKPYENDSQN